jgi:hypothetical protein
MARKPKANPVPVKPRNSIEVTFGPHDNPDEAVARTLTKPEIGAAATIQRMQGENHEVNALARELQRQIAAVNGGNLARAEGMLVAQAHTLDELFNNLARRAQSNFGEYLSAAETYLRLALKAQSQCRATLETLAQIKNPPIVYAKQANIANGPQQVNNGIPPPSHAGGNKSQPNKQSGGGNELLPDTRTPALEGGANQEVATVGEIDRAKIGGG